MATPAKGKMRRCNHPDHKGPRYLPVERFHKQGKRNGRQMYRAICKDCANAQYREQYHKGERQEWKHKASYIRARSRALTRLSKLVPELYEMCLKEELAKEPDFNPEISRR